MTKVVIGVNSGSKKFWSPCLVDAAHSFLKHPHADKTIIAVEKAGMYTAVCDFAGGKLEKLIECPKNFEFYGHGSFSADGKTLYISRVDNSTGLGYLAAYNSKTYKEEGQLQVAPGGLHDSFLLSDKKTLLITSSGLQISSYGKMGETIVSKPRLERSSVVVVDLETGKVKSKKFLDVDDQIVGHFAISTDEKKIIALTIPFVDNIINNIKKAGGAIYTGTLASDLKKVAMPKDVQEKIRGEMLSIALDVEKDRYFITNPYSSFLFEFKYSNDQLVKAHALTVNGVAIWKNAKSHQLVMNKRMSMTAPEGNFLNMNIGSDSAVALENSLKEVFNSSHILII